MHDRDDAALVRHAPFDAFGHELLELSADVLKVAIRRAVALRHRAERAHAAIRLVRPALVQLDLARRLLGAGEEAADHRRVRAGRDAPSRCRRSSGCRRRQSTECRVPSSACGDLDHGRDLRDTDAGHDARRADRARADADLHAVHAGVDERLGGLAVTMLPAMSCRFGYALLIAFTRSMTPFVWPCAVSTITTSTPASTSSSCADPCRRRCPRPRPRATRRARPCTRADSPAPSGCPSP